MEINNNLSSIGKFFDDKMLNQGLIEHPEFKRVVDYLKSRVGIRNERSILLIGKSGVGKTLAIYEALRNLGDKAWIASPSQLMAGQSYIGQIEGRIQDVTKQYQESGLRTWYLPNFHESAYLGRFKGSPISILDHLLPALDKMEIQIIGETSPRLLDNLLREYPSLHTVFEIITMEEPLDKELVEILEDWLAKKKFRKATYRAEKPVLQEVLHITQQFFAEAGQPGSSMRFLETTLNQDRILEKEYLELEADDLFQCVSNLTGVPIEILSDAYPIEVKQIKENIEKAVIGQPEAVECLSERIAMIKAGLTDPGRPWGVFLFLGSTGTGKTEICKALADYVYGSTAKLIRLDMSELQNSEDTERLIGANTADSPSDSLASQVQRTPFSVILLDEFEKAHANIWDYFLQIFDDGRLTDRLGRVVDFRSTIIVMTSNLGASLDDKSSMGFTSIDREAKRKDTISKALKQTFRPEFLNRIDRIVTFRPLTRNAMRRILHKELDSVLQRRGFYKRSWSIEWDPSAIEFLLDVGFSKTMGARPLKRAIDTHILIPISKTIISHTFPTGEQFLFVKLRGQKIVVEFVDPSAPALKPVSSETTVTKSNEFTLKGLIRSTRGEHSELQFLKKQLSDQVEITTTSAWKSSKELALHNMSSSYFWQNENRYEQLGWLEYQDRIEAGLKTAQSLFDRLASIKSDNKGGRHLEVMSSLAQQLYLLQKALSVYKSKKPTDVFLVIRSPKEKGKSEDDNWYDLLTSMYRKWAKKRRMKIEAMNYRSNTENEQMAVWAVSGFGVFEILEKEEGIHLWEYKNESNQPKKSMANIHILGLPNNSSDTSIELFEKVWFSYLPAQTNDSMQVTRRYVSASSPLVIDKVANWRTGNLDDVLSGNFDLY